MGADHEQADGLPERSAPADDDEVTSRARALALRAAGSATAVRETELFFRFLASHGLPFSAAGVTRYVASLVTRLAAGEITAATYSVKASVLRRTLRSLARGARGALSGSAHLELEALLSSIPSVSLAATRRQIAPEDLPTAEETERLIAAAEPTLALIIRFLAATGCRISEALAARLAACSLGERAVAVRLLGKGRKEREVKIPRALYEAIRARFRGAEYLFEHAGRPYSRTATTNRIRALSLRVLGRAVSAHRFRHQFATAKIAATGKIRAVADYLGHADPATTMRMYVHERLSEEELGV